MNIKKGDNVKILSGKDRGKTGKVIAVMPTVNKVLVEGLNTFKKRSRPKKQGEKGQTVVVPRGLAVSKVMLVCASCRNASRVGYRMEGSAKVRYCKACQSTT